MALLAGSAVLAAGLVTVSQRDRQFAPDHVAIGRGSVVRILNDDNVTHHVFIDAPEMSFDSGEQPVGATVELHFDKPGAFDVQCAIHPAMLLRVAVE
jgi:plastocyanin